MLTPEGLMMIRHPPYEVEMEKWQLLGVYAFSNETSEHSLPHRKAYTSEC